MQIVQAKRTEKKLLTAEYFSRTRMIAFGYFIAFFQYSILFSDRNSHVLSASGNASLPDHDFFDRFAL